MESESLQAAMDWLLWAGEDCPQHNDRYLETDGDDPYPCPRYACTSCVAALLDAYAARRVAEERERCANIAESMREEILHTSHADGLGMGDLHKERACIDIAAAIREQA